MNAADNNLKTTVKRDGTVELNGKAIGSVGRDWRTSHKASVWKAYRINLAGKSVGISGSHVTRAEAVEALVADWIYRHPAQAKRSA